MVVVIKDEQLSKKYGYSRFIVLDDETGEILDDSGGYGYRSKEGAYGAWNFRHKTKRGISKESKIKQWIKENKTFMTVALAKELYAEECDIKELMKEYNIVSEYTWGDIIEVWRKREV
jgi:hypothetical protein